jgi:hypothetical protein
LKQKRAQAPLRAAPGARCTHLAADLIAALADLNAALAPCRNRSEPAQDRERSKNSIFFALIFFFFSLSLC